MKAQTVPNIFKSYFLRPIVVTLIILALLLLLSLFVSDMQWTPSDYVIVGVLLVSFGLLLELIYKKLHNTYRVFFMVLAIILFVLFYAELAVGLFNSPFAGS